MPYLAGGLKEAGSVPCLLCVEGVEEAVGARVGGGDGSHAAQQRPHAGQPRKGAKFKIRRHTAKVEAGVLHAQLSGRQSGQGVHKVLAEAASHGGRQSQHPTGVDMSSLFVMRQINILLYILSPKI